MRYGKEHKAQTRQRIVELAAQRFRAEGLDGVGIASLMESAGLTHGGFYAHFPNKEALAAEACRSVFEQRLSRLMAVVDGTEPGRKLEMIATLYLTAQHRDHPEQGCFAAALAGEVARKPGEVQDAMTELVKQMAEWVGKCAQADGVQVSGEAIVALLLGALTLARSVSEPQQSDNFLRAGLELIRALPRIQGGQ